MFETYKLSTRSSDKTCRRRPLPPDQIGSKQEFFEEEWPISPDLDHFKTRDTPKAYAMPIEALQAFILKHKATEERLQEFIFRETRKMCSPKYEDEDYTRFTETYKTTT